MPLTYLKKPRGEEQEGVAHDAGSASEEQVQLRAMDYDEQQAALSPDGAGYDQQVGKRAPVQMKAAVQMSGGNNYDGIKSDLEDAEGHVLDKIRWDAKAKAKGKLNDAIGKLEGMKSSGQKLTSSQAKTLSFKNGKILGYTSDFSITSLCSKISSLIGKVS